MALVRIEEALWSGTMAPEGVLTEWSAPNGAFVERGAHIADVVIEGARHDIMAPATGRLWHDVEKLYVIEPGAVIGRITAR